MSSYSEVFVEIVEQPDEDEESQRVQVAAEHYRSRSVTMTAGRNKSPPTSQEGGRNRAQTFSAVAPDNAPTCLAWENLTVTVTVNNATKVLLNNIKGTISGGFWAIMGSSGGGKTTLLSTLSLRIDPSKMNVTGDITLNGRPYDKNDLKTMSAYVMQVNKRLLSKHSVNIIYFIISV